MAGEFQEFASAFKLGESKAREFKQFDPTSRTALLPTDMTIYSLDKYFDHPIRQRGLFEFETVESFVRFFNEFKRVESQIYANEKGGAIAAVFNHHGTDGTPEWGDFRASLKLAPSPEWKAWSSNNKQNFDQISFAEFLEDNLLDIVDPIAADILEATTKLESTKSVSFKSGVNLTSGEFELTYAEEEKAPQKVLVPKTFTLGLRPYLGSDPFKVTARLRYKIRDGQVSFQYILNQTEKILETVFEEIIHQIGDETGTVPFRGTDGHSGIK